MKGIYLHNNSATLLGKRKYIYVCKVVLLKHFITSVHFILRRRFFCYVCTRVYTHTHTHTYINIYIYIKPTRERERVCVFNVPDIEN
jgi:hypothetical protein